MSPSFLASSDHLGRMIIRERFPAFLRAAFSTVDPHTEFLPNWHLDALAEYLEAVRHGDIRRLIINMPPRMMKSVSVSVAWPAFLMGHQPSIKIMAASYSSYLALRHSQDARLVVSSAWFRRCFPSFALAPGRNEKHKFVTTEQGFRFATSVGGSATGEGGDILIVDDPLNPMQAESQTFREQANRWYDQTFSTRLNDKNRGRIVLVMQRLHAGDLSGHLLAKGGWEHLMLPALCERATRIAQGRFHYERPEGEPLHAAREGFAQLERARLDLGSHAFAAQYQQMPVSDKGGMIARQWIRRYDTIPEFDRIVQSWDTAIKADSRHDVSACLTFGQKKGEHFLLDVRTLREEYPALRRAIIAHAATFQPESILIEDKASGQSLLQDLRGESLATLPRLPKGDKAMRLAVVTPLIEAGKLHLPRNAPWLQAFEEELFAFPQSPHDDQIDALSQYLGWVREKEQMSARIRKL